MRKNGTVLLGENCKNKDYESCSILGIESYKVKLYENAKQFLTEPCNTANIGYTCYNLALAFEVGNEADRGLAPQYLDKACKLGYVKACEK